MPYSTDEDQNQKNPHSPSPVLISDQLIYRIASLDASVQSGFRRLDEKMDRLQNDMHNRHMEVNDRVNELDKEVAAGFLRKRTRLEAVERTCQENKRIADERMTQIETWQKVLVARFSVVGASIILIWTVFGPIVQRLLGVPQ